MTNEEFSDRLMLIKHRTDGVQAYEKGFVEVPEHNQNVVQAINNLLIDFIGFHNASSFLDIHSYI